MSGPGRAALRQPRGGEAALAAGGEGGAALGVAGREDQERVGDRVSHRLVGVEHHRLVGGMGRGGEPDRAVAQRRAPLRHRRGIRGRQRRRGLEVARVLRRRVSQERREAAGGAVVLHGDQVEEPEQRARGGRHPRPAAEAARREPGVHEGQRHAARGGAGQQARPDLAFGEDGEVRVPVVEEALDRAGVVDRRELVQRARRQAAREDPRRGGGAGGHENGEIRHAQDQRQDRQRLAHARAVEPDQGAGRPGRGGIAVALAQAVAGDASGGEPALGPEGRGLADHARERAVERQRQRRPGHRP